MPDSVHVGATSRTVLLYFTTSGQPAVTLTAATSGLIAHYERSDGTTAAITLAAGALGTWSSGGFTPLNQTNFPGCYELGIPNAALAAGLWATICITGAAGIDNNVITIPLTAYPLEKNSAYGAPFQIYMVLAADHVTPATGKSVTGQVSLDGAGFNNLANAVTEVSNGWYKVTLAAADLNGTDIAIRFAASGCDPVNLKMPISS